MNAGWTLHAYKNEMKIKNGTQTIIFDHIVKTPKSMLFCLRITREKSETGLLMTEKKISITKLHSLLGHGGEDRDRKVAKHLGIALTRLKVFSFNHALISSFARVLIGPIIGFYLIKYLNLSGIGYCSPTTPLIPNQ